MVKPASERNFSTKAELTIKTYGDDVDQRFELICLDCDSTDQLIDVWMDLYP